MCRSNSYQQVSRAPSGWTVLLLRCLSTSSSMYDPARKYLGRIRSACRIKTAQNLFLPQHPSLSVECRSSMFETIPARNRSCTEGMYRPDTALTTSVMHTCYVRLAMSNRTSAETSSAVSSVRAADSRGVVSQGSPWETSHIEHNQEGWTTTETCISLSVRR